MSEVKRKVPRRISQTVLNSLKGGVVPRIGLPYITVGRKEEIQYILNKILHPQRSAPQLIVYGQKRCGKSTLLGAVQAGCCYSFIDLRQPQPRVEKIVGRLAPAIVVVDEQLDRALFDAFPEPQRAARVEVRGGKDYLM